MAESAPLDTHIRAMETMISISSNIPEQLKQPKIAIVCGSGLGGLVESIHAQPRYEISYSEVPNFPTSTVQGHEGKLVFGLMGESQTPVVLMVGRAHFYEGHSLASVTFATRVLHLLGVCTIIVTNAAGGLNPDYAVGDVVILNDHLNLAGLSGIHPLRGPNADDFGTRFPAMSDAYDLELRKLAHRSWKKIFPTGNQRRLHEGVYAFVGGPSYETRAECRMLRILGADLVGMSTVPEIIVARHSAMRVFALSLVTNSAVLDAGPRGDDPRVEKVSGTAIHEILSEGKATHEEVLEAGRRAATDIQVHRHPIRFFSIDNVLMSTKGFNSAVG